MARAEFPARVKEAAFAKSGGLCGACQQPLQAGRIQYDHILPDRLGGKPELANCMAMCTPCHRIKTSREDVPRIAKGARQARANINATKPVQKIESAPMPKADKPKKNLNPLGAPRALYRDI
jgi:5-methylcytosine-specific restriction endonuclease McrA